MENATLTERIAQAHQRAVYSLVLYLERLQNLDPDRLQAREYYCNCLRNEAFKNANGEKEYDEEFLHQLIPALLAEYQSKQLDCYIEEVIQESMKEIIRRDILIATANSIIRDRFRDEGYSVAAANVEGDNTIYYIHTRWGIIDIESPIEELATRIDEVLRAKKKVQELL